MESVAGKMASPFSALDSPSELHPSPHASVQRMTERKWRDAHELTAAAYRLARELPFDHHTGRVDRDDVQSLDSHALSVGARSVWLARTGLHCWVDDSPLPEK